MKRIPGVLEFMAALGMAGSGIYMVVQSLLDALPSGNGAMLTFGAVFALAGSGLLVVMTQSLVWHVRKLRWSQEQEVCNFSVRESIHTKITTHSGGLD